jgi:hypothetical protein
VTGRMRRMAAVAALAVAGSGAVLGAQSALSPAQLAVIAKKTAKLSADEKQMVDGWPIGKKLAEFFCSEAGVAEIAKQHKGAGRLFLGPDDDGVKRFVVTGNTKVAGDGSVRLGADWKDLSFECTIDAEKAVVKSFTYQLK